MGTVIAKQRQHWLFFVMSFVMQLKVALRQIYLYIHMHNKDSICTVDLKFVKVNYTISGVLSIIAIVLCCLIALTKA